MNSKNIKELYKEERRDTAEQALLALQKRRREISGQQKETILQDIRSLRAAMLLLEATVDIAPEWIYPTEAAENLAHSFATDLANFTKIEEILPPPPSLWVQLSTPLSSILQSTAGISASAILLFTAHQDIIEYAKRLTPDQRISRSIEQIPSLPMWNAEFINSSGQPAFTLVHQSGAWGVGPDHICPWHRCMFTPQGDLVDLCKNCAQTTHILHYFLAQMIIVFQEKHPA